MACINKELKEFVDECFNRWLSLDSLDKENVKLRFGSTSSIFRVEGKYKKVLEKIRKEREILKKDFHLILSDDGYFYINRFKKEKEEKPKPNPEGFKTYYDHYYKFYKPKTTWTNYQ